MTPTTAAPTGIPLGTASGAPEEREELDEVDELEDEDLPLQVVRNTSKRGIRPQISAIVLDSPPAVATGAASHALVRSRGSARR